MSTSGTTWRLGRRPALDGLRGVAVLLVLIGHGGSLYKLGAFAAAGVTLFFGLSGYLITGVLLDEWKRRGRIDLRRFYTRRMTRLGPPLFVMLAAVSAITWPGWTPVLAAATWSGNYAALAGLNLEPFGHTWSLGDEEQFYLLWPIALGFLLTRGWAFRGTLTLAAVFVAWRIVLDSQGAYIYAYGALETAGSAILAGAVVALAGWHIAARWSIAGLAGVLAVSAYAAAAGGSAWLVVPLLVTPFVALLLAASPSARWLAWRPLTTVGIASYSLYLWHEPVSFMLTGTLTPGGVLCGSLVGAAGYLLVEAPVMRWRSRGYAMRSMQAQHESAPGESTVVEEPKAIIPISIQSPEVSGI